MSVLEVTLEPNVIVFAALAVIAISCSILVVEYKSLVYSAFFLGVLGAANAVLFAFLGFGLVALFHLAVYIGAAVTFILFSITMFEEAPPSERKVRLIAVSSVLLTIFLFAISFSVYLGKPLQSEYLDYRELTALLIQKYWFALIIAAITLVTTLIEAITLARQEVE